ncbi:MAG: hypothetical protein GXP53_00195 [Deltaproteobacteria bacterium]|nr:hypothetical protein [Deltaproteobacteria bacterium]
MKKLHYAAAVLAILSLTVISGIMIDGRKCMAAGDEAQPAVKAESATPAPDAAKAKTSEPVTARVVESIITNDYTYVLVDTGKEKIWTATREFTGDPGDAVVIPPGIPMSNFHSKSLDRDFEKIYFVESIGTPGKSAGAGLKQKMPKGHPAKGGMMGGMGMSGSMGSKAMGGKAGAMKMPASMGALSGSAAVKPGSVKRAKGGKTIAEVIADSKNLAGKKILLRAKVVKFTPSIMGKNWLHVQDGTGDKNMGELIVTTSATVKVGDLVLISGMVSVNRDFGFGLKYKLIVENAEITVE